MFLLLISEKVFIISSYLFTMASNFIFYGYYWQVGDTFLWSTLNFTHNFWLTTLLNNTNWLTICISPSNWVIEKIFLTLVHAYK